MEGDRFEERFGIRFEEPLIRFRILDKSLNTALRVPFSDAAIPLSVFCGFDWQGLRIIVSENKMTFLTLPSVTNGIGVWGAGNAAALLHNVGWLTNCHIYYWGDLDTQGLNILSRLRGNFPQTKSLMMDIDTFKLWQSLSGSGTPSNSSCPLNLTPAETRAWSAVHSENRRLEQERIPASFARLAINEVLFPE